MKQHISHYWRLSTFVPLYWLLTSIREMKHHSGNHLTCTDRPALRVGRALTRGTFALWIQHGSLNISISW